MLEAMCDGMQAVRLVRRRLCREDGRCLDLGRHLPVDRL
jgi:hypothetical protein